MTSQAPSRAPVAAIQSQQPTPQPKNRGSGGNTADHATRISRQGGKIRLGVLGVMVHVLSSVAVFNVLARLPELRSRLPQELLLLATITRPKDGGGKEGTRPRYAQQEIQHYSQQQRPVASPALWDDLWHYGASSLTTLLEDDRQQQNHEEESNKTDIDDMEEEESYVVLGDSTRTLSRKSWQKEDDAAIKQDASGLTPEGQHLVMDLFHVDATFLRAADGLVQGLEAGTAEVGLALDSYHCQTLLAPMGVSCLARLSDGFSRIVLHTFPAANRLALDLHCASCSGTPSARVVVDQTDEEEEDSDDDEDDEEDSDDDEEESDTSLSSSLPLLDFIPALTQSLGVASPSSEKTVFAQWWHKNRGFTDYERDPETGAWLPRNVQGNLDAGDAGNYVLSLPGHLHKQVLLKETSTRFQTVQVYGFEHQSLAYGWRTAGSSTLALSPSRNPPPCYECNKKVFLDGVMQSTLHGLQPYHEALVHPAMISHSNPKRVAIIGGGEGATLREVLKHSTVEKVVMIDIDGEFMDLAREHLPEWNDCSDLVVEEDPDDAEYTKTVSLNCFDHPRASVYAEDAIAWFINRFNKNKTDIKESEKFDVIIMDALDPSSAVEFSDILYGDETFISSLVNSLTIDGVLVLQTGDADNGDYSPTDRDLDLTDLLRRFDMLIQKNGAVSSTSYSEAHGQFDGPWDFYIYFMDHESKANFYSDAATIDLELAHRAVWKADEKSSPFMYFDGASMMSYQAPSRHVEYLFCSERPDASPLCSKHRGFDPDIPNVHSSSMKMGPSLIPNAGRGLFFTQDHEKGSYLAIDDSVHSMLVTPWTFMTLKQMWNESLPTSDLFEIFAFYLYGYGFANEFYGAVSYVVDPGQSTFANHGCNGTYVTGWPTSVTELTADPLQMPPDLLYTELESPFDDPVADRNHHSIMTTSTLLHSVRAGDEVTDNYLSQSTEEEWHEDVHDLRAQCSGTVAGTVTEYEQA